MLDPSRVTLSVGAGEIDGDRFTCAEFMDLYGVQIDKTSRNTGLFMTSIGTPRSSVACLVEVPGINLSDRSVAAQSIPQLLLFSCASTSINSSAICYRSGGFWTLRCARTARINAPAQHWRGGSAS